VELESPQDSPILKDGHFAESARKGINQINDWRKFIQSNLDFVTKQKSNHGLGLHDIRPRSAGLVVVGRRELYESHPALAKYEENRAISLEQDRIQLVSYESFLKNFRFEYEKF